MAGVKGRSGPKKGFRAPNRYSRNGVKEFLPKAGMILEEAIEMVFRDDTTKSDKIKLIGIVLPYIESKLATVELTGKDGEPIAVDSRVIIIPMKELRELDGYPE